MNDLVYHFGRCELRMATHELIVDKQLQPLEPLAFDLLAYLLELK